MANPASVLKASDPAMSHFRGTGPGGVRAGDPVGHCAHNMHAWPHFQVFALVMVSAWYAVPILHVARAQPQRHPLGDFPDQMK